LTRPTCDEDDKGRLLSEIPRVDLTASFELRVSASGAVDRIAVVDFQPALEDVADLAKRFGECFRRKARYDTVGMSPVEFPKLWKLTVTWKARESTPGFNE
jgi:hypothetical protein